VRDEVAAELGLGSSATGSPVRVITGLPDLHNAVVASGAAGLYEPHVALGTTAWVSCPLPGKKTDILHQQAAVPGLDADHYLLANNQDSAGRALEWLRERALAGLGTSEVPTAEEIVALAGTAPPGAGGVMFTPWLTGERSPIDDRYARAGFHNLGVTAGSAELARAVLEGVAFNLRWLLEAADSYTKRRLDPIRLLGGCARSDLWCQIVADVCDRSFERVADPVVAGLRGAGLTWALATGDVQRADLRALVPVDRVFAPNAAHRAAYDRMYAEFPRLHSRNKRFFAALNR
ncbi:MAG: FGGY-family carbohydrate kinase, partial [Nocardioides sp.]